MRGSIVLPTNMSLSDWADQTLLNFDKYGAMKRLEDESLWQDWAMQFLNNTALKENFPVPYDFDDWQEWAERFCQVIL